MNTQQLRHAILLAAVLFCLALPLLADSITFSLLPPDGNVSGAAGSLVGWGYSLTNDSSADWFLATNLNSDSFSNCTPTSLFDFPDVAPGAIVTEAFDSVNSIGLYELQWDPSAPVGFVNSGDFTLSGKWYDGDPFNGGTFIADATDTELPYTATVTGATSTVPEPSSAPLLLGTIVLIIGCRGLRRLWCSLFEVGRRAVRGALLTLLAVFVSVAQNAAGPVENNPKDSTITRQQADDILNELRQIRQLLERQSKPGLPSRMPAVVPQTGKLRLDGGFSLGSSDAPLAIVEFTDYECPFCRQFESTTFAEIRKKYIDTGKVRFVIRDFPLDGHPDAMPAAEAARCAGDQGKFWPMHDALFSDVGKLGQKGLIDYAEALTLDAGTFRSCLESGKHKLEVQNDVQVAASLQINATPSFLIGRITRDEVSGSIVLGALPFSAFEAKLKEAELH